MGSFNTTCAISHTPIRDGDAVRLFFLKSNSDDHNGFECYPHDNFQIVGGIALKATYADYNNYEFDEDSVEAKYILSLLKEEYLENVPEPGVKYNEYHDHMSIKVEDLDFETIQNMTHSGRFFVRKYGKEKGYIATMAVHESIFNVVQAKSYENHEFDDNRNSIYTTFTLEDEIAKEIASQTAMTYEQCFKIEYEKVLERHKDKLGGEDSEKILELVERLAEFAAEEKVSGLYDSDSHRYEYIVNRRNPVKYMARFLREQKKLESEEYDDVEAHNIQLSLEELESVVRPVCEVRFFNIGMYTYNLMYRPIMTSGQEHDLPAHAQFLHEMADAISMIPSPWGDDESIATKIHKELWQEVTLTQLKARYDEWYDDEADKRLQPIIDKMGDSEMIVIQPSEWSYREDPLDIYDIFDNKAVELRILNK